MRNTYAPILISSKPTRSNRWFAYSPKLRRTVYAPKQLHFDRLLLIEADPDVVEYCEQPADATSWVRARLYTVRIDYWIRLRDGSEWYERMSYANAPTRACPSRAACEDWADRQGGAFRTAVAEVVRNDPLRIANLRRILGYYNASAYEGYLRKHLPAEHAIERLVRNQQSTPVSLVLAALSAEWGEQAARFGLFDLVLKGRICAELSRRSFDGGSRLKFLSPP